MRAATRRIVAVALCGMIAQAAAGTKPTPSGPLKAYKGPEGELIVMVPVNDDKQMLVHFRKLGGELDNTTRLYEVDDLGQKGKDVYENRKRGSKTHRFVVLTQREGDWDFYHPIKPNVELHLVYSESASDRIKVDEVLGAYKP